MKRKLQSRQNVMKLPDQENKIICNWITHYIHDKIYGKGVGSTSEHREHVNGNYVMICNKCNHLFEVRINTEMKSDISMHSNIDNFFYPKTMYEGNCPNCKLLSKFSIVPLYFANHRLESQAHFSNRFPTT